MTSKIRPLKIRQAIERARTRYADHASNDVEIDDTAPVTPNDHGVWVQAWVHVSDADIENSEVTK